MPVAACPTPTHSGPARIRRYTRHKVLLLAVIALFSVIRFRLREMPLERDEGEYAYAGRLLLEGIPPYQLAYNMKLPGAYAAYAGIFSFLGQSTEAVHIGLILANTVTILLIALLGRRLFGAAGGLAAGACYALLSTSPTVLGFAAHATHFVALAAVAGALLLLEPKRKSGWAIFGGGLLMGTAMLMKQPGAAFIAFGAVYLLVKRPQVLRAYLAGAVLPFGLTCLLLWRCGVFERFWFWTVSYGKQYGSLVSPSDGLLLLLGALPKVVGPSILLWMLAVIGAYRLIHARRSFFPLSLLLFSGAAVSAGFYFRSHYFVMLLPAVSLLAGASLATESKIAFRASALVFAAGMGLSLLLQREYLFVLGPAQASARTYGGNPFAGAQSLAHYLREHSSPQTRIAVLGSEPEIYFYARRHSATGYVYTYGLMEPQKYAGGMQREMIAEIERAQPEYFVYVHSPPSWQRKPNSENYIFSWADRYLATQYEPVEAPGAPSLQTYRRKATVEAVR